eukprot:Cvel_23979.t1-p1 / transcript=Cvel_23979.t1 / gene=Cvel_23979 / organism=Chromera_velia_CCMP2878 / gene_product=hypothetical protein / transcript_product=hypothetical protein / location=Cvel_scaffold2539:1-3248(-) / protein_length=803 / sequence_SO=supercontig / SO=protein_coding / is_pseudo=false
MMEDGIAVECLVQAAEVLPIHLPDWTSGMVNASLSDLPLPPGAETELRVHRAWVSLGTLKALLRFANKWVAWRLAQTLSSRNVRLCRWAVHHFREDGPPAKEVARTCLCELSKSVRVGWVPEGAIDLFVSNLEAVAEGLEGVSANAGFARALYLLMAEFDSLILVRFFALQSIERRLEVTSSQTEDASSPASPNAGGSSSLILPPDVRGSRSLWWHLIGTDSAYSQGLETLGGATWFSGPASAVSSERAFQKALYQLLQRRVLCKVEGCRILKHFIVLADHCRGGPLYGRTKDGKPRGTGPGAVQPEAVSGPQSFRARMRGRPRWVNTKMAAQDPSLELTGMGSVNLFCTGQAGAEGIEKEGRFLRLVIPAGDASDFTVGIPTAAEADETIGAPAPSPDDLSELLASTGSDCAGQSDEDDDLLHAGGESRDDHSDSEGGGSLEGGEGGGAEGESLEDLDALSGDIRFLNPALICTAGGKLFGRLRKGEALMRAWVYKHLLEFPHLSIPFSAVDSNRLLWLPSAALPHPSSFASNPKLNRVAPEAAQSVRSGDPPASASSASGAGPSGERPEPLSLSMDNENFNATISPNQPSPPTAGGPSSGSGGRPGGRKIMFDVHPWYPLFFFFPELVNLSRNQGGPGQSRSFLNWTPSPVSRLGGGTFVWGVTRPLYHIFGGRTDMAFKCQAAAVVDEGETGGGLLKLARSFRVGSAGSAGEAEGANDDDEKKAVTASVAQSTVATGTARSAPPKTPGTVATVHRASAVKERPGNLPPVCILRLLGGSKEPSLAEGVRGEKGGEKGGGAP